jgi:hypothetical protein
MSHQSYFLLTITTITIASNWSFIALRNQYTKKDDRYPYPNSQHPPPPQPPYQQQQHQALPPASWPLESQYPPMEYPKTPGRGESSPTRNHHYHYPRNFDVNKQEEEEPQLLLENTPSRKMDFVTERTRDRQLHSRTTSPSKRERYM